MRGVSVKTRRMFRAIYKAALTTTKVDSVDGDTVMSPSFPIRRGVVQGDITSPLYFVLALEQILRNHDTIVGKGVDFGARRVHTLGYADDAALIDYTPDMATKRVTAIAKGSRTDADMHISIDKTKC